MHCPFIEESMRTYIFVNFVVVYVPAQKSSSQMVSCRQSVSICMLIEVPARYYYKTYFA